MDPDLRRAIESLRTLKVKELKVRYRQLFGQDSPSSNHEHLFRRIAWRLQAREAGDLSERARQRAAELADDVDLRLRVPGRFWRELADDSQSQSARRDPRLPATGTVLRRPYQGRLIEVTVLEDKFLYSGDTYSSLSAIAYRVTGTRWNGFLFFGLSKNDAGN